VIIIGQSTKSRNSIPLVHGRALAGAGGDEYAKTTITQADQKMLKHLLLQRTLAVIDLETTGANPVTDRAVEISVLKIAVSGALEQKTQRLNPGVPIPPGATAVHGISDADVADQPRFAEVARNLLHLLDDCDLCGFNRKRFDLPLLIAEFARASLPFSLNGRAIIDPMQIYHAYERRDLAAAVRFYCGREHVEAHSAAGDAAATIEVLDSMLGRYADLPRGIADLSARFENRHVVDLAGKFVRIDGEVVFAFGKYKGRRLCDIATEDRSYLDWIVGGEFHEQSKEVVRKALRQSDLKTV
jgi:DNA polymerase-3 subunit epsilon